MAQLVVELAIDNRAPEESTQARHNGAHLSSLIANP
jgi:hypothetical protein